jgi:predicted transcriptional regulator
MGIGLVSIVTRSFVEGLWILLIGWFLNSGAQSYLQQQELGSILSGVRLRDFMNTNIIAVKKGSNLYDTITNYFEVYMKTTLPVVSEAGSLTGQITLSAATSIPENKRQVTIIDDLMTPRNDLIVMNFNNNAYQALNEMAKKMNMLFVCNAEGKIQGLVTKTRVLNIAAERTIFKHSNVDNLLIRINNI